MAAFSFAELHREGVSSARAAQLATEAGVPRLLIIKAMADRWGVQVKTDEIGASDPGGYPSVAARETATFALAGLVAAYPNQPFADFLEFEKRTGISVKIDALAMADRVPDALAFYDRLEPGSLELRELTDAEARAIAAEHIGEAAGELRIQDASTQTHPWGWLFLYQSAAYLDTGDFALMIAGNAPLIVDRFTGVLWTTGTASRPDDYIEHYRRTGTPHPS